MNPEPKPKPEDNVLWHQSGINVKGEPFVQLILNEKVITQMEPGNARDHALAILAAAEAAEQDACLWHWAMEVLGADVEGATMIIARFRDYRTGTTGKKGGPSDPKDWVRNDSE